MKSLILLTLILLVGCNQKPAWAEINLKIIATIESGNNPQAYNKGSKATGMYQITPICLKDYNQAHRQTFQLSEMFYPSKAEKVASWYLNRRIPALLRHYNIADTTENRLRAYNSGIGVLVGGRYPIETRNYVSKYKDLEILF
jgi:hypothetical protein